MLRTLSDEVAQNVEVAVADAFVTAELKPGEVGENARETNIFICQGLAVVITGPWVTEPLKVCDGRAIEEADPVLKVYIENNQHAAELAHKRHALDAIEVRDPLHAFTDRRSTCTLFASNAGLLQRYSDTKISSKRRVICRSKEK